jgi:branched-chain amino acid transport system substrate-binding protein
VTSLPCKTMLWAAAAMMVALPALANDTLRIGYVDPLSGSGGSVGVLGLRTFEYLADHLNAEGGVLGMKVKIVGYDDKLSAEEAIVQVKKATGRRLQRPLRILSPRTTPITPVRKFSI